MADEFIKGLGILVTAGLGWMTLAGWYNTEGFESTQLVAPDPTQGLTVYDSLALLVGDVLFWMAILGPVAFWLLIPGYRKAREAYRGEPELPE